jgi:hypothetical protein
MQFALNYNLLFMDSRLKYCDLVCRVGRSLDVFRDVRIWFLQSVVWVWQSFANLMPLLYNLTNIILSGDHGDQPRHFGMISFHDDGDRKHLWNIRLFFLTRLVIWENFIEFSRCKSFQVIYYVITVICFTLSYVFINGLKISFIHLYYYFCLNCPWALADGVAYIFHARKTKVLFN